MQEGSRFSQDEIFQAIITERAYQKRDLVDKGWRHKGTPSVEAEILLIEEYTQKLRTAWVIGKGNEQALDVMRKIAGIIVRCGENHGLPPRD